MRFGRVTMLSAFLVLGTAILSISGDAATSTTPATQATQAAPASASPKVAGLYMVVHVDRPIVGNRKFERALVNPNVDGVYLHASWKRIEPAPGKYDWSYFDTQIAAVVAAHKRVSLSIRAGGEAPEWLYKAGAQPFHTVVQPKRRQEFCSPVTLPVPWNTVYLDAWTRLIRAFGQRYANNPAVVLVKITGISYRTDETNLPHAEGGTVTSDVTGTTCNIPNDVAVWKSIGYTSVKVDAAFQRIAQTFGTAFPRQYLSLMTADGAFPPLGDQGQPSEEARRLGTSDFFRIGRQTLGARFVGQNNGLSAFKVEPGVVAFGRTGTIAFQTALPVSGGRNCRSARRQAQIRCGGVEEMQQSLDGALQARARYIELFPEDILNPAFAGVMANAHQRVNAAR